MAKKKKIRGDRIIWIVVILLAMISLLSVYSSSSSLAYKYNTTTSQYLFKQFTFVLSGFFFLFVCYFIPIWVYRKTSYLTLIVSVLALLYTFIRGATINDAARWIEIGGMTIQPSEFAKIAIILYLARVLETKDLSSFKNYTLWILIPIGITLVLCLLGSASVTIIIAFVIFVLLLCFGINKKYILITIGMAVAAVGIVVLINRTTGAFNRVDTVIARIERSFNSDKSKMSEAELREYNEKTYQSNEAKGAIQLGGESLFGRGPGNGLKKNTLPHPYSDFAYATIVEESGIIGAIAIMALYAFFFVRCISIAENCKKVFSTVTVLGLGLMIVTQAFVHILVNVGILPVTGQTLPLISLGGTSYVIMSCAFGIILSINKTIEIKIEQEKNG